MVRPERLLALHRQGRLLSSFHLLSHLWEASNITTRAISQFPRPVFHRQDTQHYGLQTKFTKWSNFVREAWLIKEKWNKRSCLKPPMNADARRCSAPLIGVHRRFPTLGGMRSAR